MKDERVGPPQFFYLGPDIASQRVTRVTGFGCQGHLQSFVGLQQGKIVTVHNRLEVHCVEVGDLDRMAETLAPFEGMAIDQLAANPQAVALGQSVFGNFCATCHGSDARGARGFPNLTDASWQWGGSPDEVATSVIHGRQAAMPAMEAMLGEQGATEVAVYVQQLAGMQADAGLAAAGKARFDTICAACHMPDGTGMAALGAPNLTDDVWLYGSDFDTIRQGVLQGRAGMMPAHGPIVGETRARLAAAYVWSLSHGAGAAGND